MPFKFNPLTSQLDLITNSFDGNLGTTPLTMTDESSYDWLITVNSLGELVVSPTTAILAEDGSYLLSEANFHLIQE